MMHWQDAAHKSPKGYAIRFGRFHVWIKHRNGDCRVFDKNSERLIGWANNAEMHSGYMDWKPIDEPCRKCGIPVPYDKSACENCGTKTGN